MKDIIVGIPSFNNSKTISRVTRQIYLGLLKYFKKQNSLIINSDGGSTDNTPKIFLNTKTSGIEKISLKYKGPSGKGSAQKAVFEILQREKAKVGAVFDSDLQSITPEWIKDILEPILNKTYDFSIPFYLRHKYDGTITNTLVYPLTTALYGKKIRQPISGDFAFSKKLVKTWLSYEIPSDFGIDIFMTTTTIVQGFKICQVYLGPKIHQSKDPHELTPMFIQVTKELFKLAKVYKDIWEKIDKIEEVPIFGKKSRKVPSPIKIDLKRLKRYNRITQDVWVKTVYDFLLQGKPVEQLVSYYLRAASSLILDDWSLDNLVLEFLRQKGNK